MLVNSTIGRSSIVLLMLFAQAIVLSAQLPSQVFQLSGTYRIDVAASDKLYTVVESATSNVPFGDQQRFFMDLSTRLTLPDMIAIECRGRRVSIASSRASKITFTADGITRRESRGGGTFVNSSIKLGPDRLTFTSSGMAEDDLNVTFQALDGGQRLKVVRRISSEQLDEPLIITTYYDKFAEAVNWDDFSSPKRSNNADVAERTPVGGEPERQKGSGDASLLRSALLDWIGATNRRDIGRQMTYYMPQLKAYYLSRNTSRQAVLDEKERVFKNAKTIQIAADDPEIVFQDNGKTAVMRFHKKYKVADRTRTRSGEVIQELRWQKTPSGWRIFSERDIRVLRQG